MAVINYFDFRYSVKGLLSSGVLPHIGHFYLWVRDLIYDMVHGTPLEGKVEAVKGWPRVDTSVEPTVPRGLVAAEARPVGQQNVPVVGGVKRRHSMEPSNVWLQRAVGRSLPNNLQQQDGLMAALPALAASISVNPAQLLAQTGVRATVAAIEGARERVALATTTRLRLSEANFSSTVAPHGRKVVSEPGLRVKEALPKAGSGKARSGAVSSVWPGMSGINVQVPTLAGAAGGGGEGGGGGGGVHVPEVVVVPESKEDRSKRMARDRKRKSRTNNKKGVSKEGMEALKACGRDQKRKSRTNDRKGMSKEEMEASKAHETQMRKDRKRQANSTIISGSSSSSTAAAANRSGNATKL